MKHDVIITHEVYEGLCRDRESLEEYQKSGKFTRYNVYYSMGYTLTITTNDTIYDSIVDQLNQTQNHLYQLMKRNEELEKENQNLKSRGFFKRLFS